VNRNPEPKLLIELKSRLPSLFLYLVRVVEFWIWCAIRYEYLIQCRGYCERSEASRLYDPDRW